VSRRSQITLLYLPAVPTPDEDQSKGTLRDLFTKGEKGKSSRILRATKMIENEGKRITIARSGLCRYDSRKITLLYNEILIFALLFLDTFFKHSTVESGEIERERRGHC
jgi:hypothetical protein